MRCRFSHLKKTFAPLRSSTWREVITGVRLACGLMRSCAAATSSYETISAPVLDSGPGDFLAPLLQEVAAVVDQIRLGTAPDPSPELRHDRDAEHRILDADRHEAFAFPCLA